MIFGLMVYNWHACRFPLRRQVWIGHEEVFRTLPVRNLVHHIAATQIPAMHVADVMHRNWFPVEDKRATTNVQNRFVPFFLLSFLLFCSPWAQTLCFQVESPGGKILKKCQKVWKSVKNYETILPFSCCPLVFPWDFPIFEGHGSLPLFFSTAIQIFWHRVHRLSAFAFSSPVATLLSCTQQAANLWPRATTRLCRHWHRKMAVAIAIAKMQCTKVRHF